MLLQQMQRCSCLVRNFARYKAPWYAFSTWCVPETFQKLQFQRGKDLPFLNSLDAKLVGGSQGHSESGSFATERKNGRGTGQLFGKRFAAAWECW